MVKWNVCKYAHGRMECHEMICFEYCTGSEAARGQGIAEEGKDVTTRTDNCTQQWNGSCQENDRRGCQTDQQRISRKRFGAQKLHQAGGRACSFVCSIFSGCSIACFSCVNELTVNYFCTFLSTYKFLNSAFCTKAYLIHYFISIRLSNWFNLHYSFIYNSIDVLLSSKLLICNIIKYCSMCSIYHYLFHLSLISFIHP